MALIFIGVVVVLGAIIAVVVVLTRRQRRKSRLSEHLNPGAAQTYDAA